MQAILKEYALVAKDRKDQAAVGHLLARGLNPDFFKPPHKPENIVRVVTNGTQGSGKSVIADEMVLAMFPDLPKDFSISGFNEERGGEYFQITEYSRLLGGLPITASFKEMAPKTIGNRAHLPGIHFDQNALMQKIDNAWISLEVRIPSPVRDEDYSEILIDIEAEFEGIPFETVAPDVLMRYQDFAYLQSVHFPDMNVRKAFALAVRGQSPKASLVTVRIHDERLIQDPAFQNTLKTLEKITENPFNAEDIVSADL
jgi:hypothetical protein